MSIKCPKCGEFLIDNDIVVWRCPECNNGYKGTILFLKNHQKKKEDNFGKNTLLCEICKSCIDNGKERIFAQCSSCNNILKGNLEYFTRDEGICPDCASTVPWWAKFCPGCGKRIVSEQDKNIEAIVKEQLVIDDVKDDAEERIILENTITETVEDTITDEWEILWDKLLVYEKNLIKILFEPDKNIIHTKLIQLSKDCDILLEVLIEGINEKAIEIIGDNLLDSNSDVLTIYEDYNNEIARIIKDGE